MAPCQVSMPTNITADLIVANVEVTALVDSGATMSCCSKEWYLQNQYLIGELMQDNTTVVGVGDQSIQVTGRTQLLPLE